MRAALGNKGFSLLEAIVAVTIMTIGIIALSKLLQVSLYHYGTSTEQRNADLIAAEIFEELKGEVASTNTYKSVLNLQNLTLTDPKFVPSGPINTTPANCTGSCVESMGTYAGRLYKWRVDDSQGAQTWRLFVTVGWGTCTGTDPSTCTYTTRLSNFLVPAR